MTQYSTLKPHAVMLYTSVCIGWDFFCSSGATLASPITKTETVLWIQAVLRRVQCLNIEPLNLYIAITGIFTSNCSALFQNPNNFFRMFLQYDYIPTASTARCTPSTKKRCQIWNRSFFQYFPVMYFKDQNDFPVFLRPPTRERIIPGLLRTFEEAWKSCITDGIVPPALCQSSSQTEWLTVNYIQYTSNKQTRW